MRSFDSKAVSRRSALRGLVALAGGTALTPLLAACGGTSGQGTASVNSTGQAAAAVTAATSSTAAQSAAAPGQAATTIHLYTWTAAANLPTWKQALASFQTKNPTIQVVMDYTPGQQDGCRAGPATCRDRVGRLTPTVAY